jgi:hypothetical protein
MPLNRPAALATIFVGLLLLAPPGALSASDTNGDGLEIILIPIAFGQGNELAGLQGTRWRGEVWLHNEASQSVDLQHLVPCLFTEACTATYPSGYTDRLTVGLVGAPDHGILLSPSAAVAQQLTFSSRLFEISRGAQPLGVDVPVVHEDQFLRTTTYLLGLPGGAKVRTSLRIYDPRREGNRNPETTVLVEILRPDTPLTNSGTVVAALPITTVTPPFSYGGLAPGYAAIYDLAAAFPAIAELDYFHIRLTPIKSGTEFWAMASATDNETQQVVLITPH